jgi:hypothetical protein
VQVCTFSDVILTASRRLDSAIVAVGPNEEWTRIKVHGVDTRRYIGKLDKLKKDLMTDNDGLDIPMSVRWLANELTVKQRTNVGSIRASSVAFAVKDRGTAIHAIRKGLFLAGRCLRAEPYLRASPDAFCDHCSGWGHLAVNCGSGTIQAPPRCAHCSRPHLTTAHTCNVLGCAECDKRPGRICKHSASTLKCPNCKGKHSAKSDMCPKKKEAIKKAKFTPTRSGANDPISGANTTPIGPKEATTNQPAKAGRITIADTPRPRLISQPAAPSPVDVPDSDTDDAMTDASDLPAPAQSVPATPEAEEL